MTKRRRRSDGSGRAPLFSPGRPVVAGRDEQRWFWAATRMTTPCVRVSSRPSSASRSIGVGSRHRPKPEAPLSSSSKASTIRAAGTPRSDISPRSIMSGVIKTRQSIPTHTSLPPCSRPSRTSPSGAPKKGPSLTAAVRGSSTVVRVGTEEWLRQGPNQRMS